jgi:hypothetical protein
VDLDGNEICLEHLDAEERKLLARIRRRARSNPDWDDFDNFWTRVVPAFYQARGLGRKAVPQTILWRVAGDLSGRIAVAAGLARVGDYRDDLEWLIREHFPSQRAFCEATGLSEDMLSHVLAGRKDLSLSALEQALGRIGYRLQIRPAPKPEVATRRARRPARGEAVATAGGD